jgi:hypothetical protein
VAVRRDAAAEALKRGRDEEMPADEVKAMLVCAMPQLIGKAVSERARKRRL